MVGLQPGVPGSAGVTNPSSFRAVPVESYLIPPHARIKDYVVHARKRSAIVDGRRSLRFTFLETKRSSRLVPPATNVTRAIFVADWADYFWRSIGTHKINLRAPACSAPCFLARTPEVHLKS